MTYCLAISVDDGLVFASDSRTNAGVDYVATYSKMTRFVFENNRVLVLLTSGSLATSQAVVNGIKRDLNDPNAEFDISQGQYLHEVAQYIGKLSQSEQRLHAKAIEKSNASTESSFILGGQIEGQACEIFLIYPQGNFISASAETPYLQIGESKYGKPILDRIISAELSLSDAARCAAISLDSTMRSNVSVGPPIELALHKKEVIQDPAHIVLSANSTDFQSLQNQWNEGMKSAFNQLPRLDWDKYNA
ncbi:20S proteasome subunit A/B [uncultured Paraglaciecola sp.]|uniref:20S proteasome subunit A/B n=1 Tax=uncultured Paraglaciecola sp. TaxID=1765024 RepID=UPI0030D74203|tara:strand:+ start:2769 stop:3512 length:744 start_codon:yes stop_codon:yes gene_type:complete